MRGNWICMWTMVAVSLMMAWGPMGMAADQTTERAKSAEEIVTDSKDEIENTAKEAVTDTTTAVSDSAQGVVHNATATLTDSVSSGVEGAADAVNEKTNKFIKFLFGKEKLKEEEE